MNKFRLLRADEIDCRISMIKENGLSLLLYKDARCDMNILDETFGEFGWQRKHELIDGQLFCSVGILHDGQWVWKQDVGTESYTEKEKGRASDSFKRACFNWGIGRELYTAPFIWISNKNCKIEKNRNGNGWTCYDRFSVGDIYYDNFRRINGLTIKKDGVVVYRIGNPENDMATEKEKKVTFALAMKKFGEDKEQVKKFYADQGVNYSQMTAADYLKLVKALQ